MTGVPAVQPMPPTGGAPLLPADDDLTAYYLRRPVAYQPVWERQRTLARARADGEIGNLLLLLEHEPVYTLGLRGDDAHLLADGALLARQGITCQRVDRGGDITYHGPGQLIGYPIVRLRGAGRGVRAYVGALETALIRIAAYFGVVATSVPGYSGVWVGEEKLAAIGIRISRGVAYHGFALNVATDLTPFRQIVPCGLRGKGVTSLSALLGREVSIDEVAPLCARAVAATCELRLTALNTLDEASQLVPLDDAAASRLANRP